MHGPGAVWVERGIGAAAAVPMELCLLCYHE